MPWTVTRTDATIRLDVMDNLDDEGRPGSHRVFEYPLDRSDVALFDDGGLRSASVISAEVRRRAKAQLALEDETAAPEERVDLMVASGERL